VRPQFLVGAGAVVAEIVAFWVLLYVWAASELYIGWRYRLASTAETRDRGSRTVLIASVWTGVAAGIGCSILLQGAAIRMGRHAIFALGLVLMLVGLVLRWWAISVLGRSFTVTVGTQAEQRVVESGPYQFVRHPSYTGSLLTIAGILLCCTNVLSLLSFLLPMAGYAYRIRVEELALIEGLGEPYRAYMRRTRRLIPFIL
jgi:protein-S-isoprenylcysteine O-methyltransferase Ste14